MTIVTHDGPFHADDVIAVGILSLLFSLSWVRTRDEDTVNDADFAIDVGGTYDPVRGRFDHHQFRAAEGEGPIRESGTPLASAGLVWAEYGLQYVRQVLDEDLPEVVGTPEAFARVVERVDRDFIQGVDALDTGTADTGGIPEGVQTFSSTIAGLNPTWLEQGGGADFDKQFHIAVARGMATLRRAVHSAVAEVLAEDEVLGSQRLCGGRVLKLERFVPWAQIELPEEVLFVIFPGPDDAGYRLQQVPVSLGSFEGRKRLPEAWAGLRGQELADAVGLTEHGSSTFCHPGDESAGAERHVDIMNMAMQALLR